MCVFKCVCVYLKVCVCLEHTWLQGTRSSLLPPLVFSPINPPTNQIYPLDATFDTPEDVPEAVKTNKRCVCVRFCCVCVCLLVCVCACLCVCVCVCYKRGRRTLSHLSVRLLFLCACLSPPLFACVCVCLCVLSLYDSDTPAWTPTPSRRSPRR